MFERWFGRREEAPRPAARVPEGVRVYAIGDIHGRLDLLSALRAKIVDHGHDFPGRRAIIYLGDYIDRGLDSRGVIELLSTEPMEGFEQVFLRGNHDDWLLHFLQDSAQGTGWLLNGGDATLYSYGVRSDDGESKSSRMSEEHLRQAQTQLRAAMPAHHVKYFNALELSHVEGGYFFVHAGVRPGRALEEQSPDDLIWIREDFLGSSADFGKVVVHGHSISYEPEMRPNRIGVDTGAYFSGALTSLVLEGEHRTLLQTGSDAEPLWATDG